MRPPVPGRPLTVAQRRVLVALVEECTALGQEVTTQGVADLAKTARGAATLALRGLVRRQLVVTHDAELTWSPTLTGRAKARELQDRAARTGTRARPEGTKPPGPTG